MKRPMATHEGQTLTAREMVRAHLPIALQLINAVSLAVIAASAVYISAHVHEVAHDGMIWRDPPATEAEKGHQH